MGILELCRTYFRTYVMPPSRIYLGGPIQIGPRIRVFRIHQDKSLLVGGLGGMNCSSVSLDAPGNGWEKKGRQTKRQTDGEVKTEGRNKKIGNKLYYY